MKKIQFVFMVICGLVFMFPQSLYAQQIDIMEGPKKNEKPQPQIVQYDSLLNFNASLDFGTYIGQRVYCVKAYRTSMLNDQSRHPSEYNLQGKYLMIVSNNLLMDEDSTLYNLYGKYFYATGGLNDAFVILGHIEKMRELYEGKDFIFVNEEEENWYDVFPFNGIFDRKTHKRRYDIKKGSQWHCDGVGVSLDDKYSPSRQKTLCSRVVLYLSNDKYDSVYCYVLSNEMESKINYVDGKKSNKYILNKFMTPQAYAKQQNANATAAKAKKEANEKAASERRQRLVNAYGEKKAKMILRGEVAIGFTKSMCREAWGAPKSVNTTETARVIHEQWVYGGGRYLYFDNGVLTSIQR